MEITVTSKYLRMSPRKLRPAVNFVRGKLALEARDILRFQSGKAPRLINDLLISAIASAKNSELDDSNLIIKTIVVSDGPRLKRGTPVSKGSYMPIVKKQSHLTLTLSDENMGGKGKLGNNSRKE